MNMRTMDKLSKILCEELDDIATKGAMSMGDLEIVYKATGAIKNIEKLRMMDEGGRSNSYEQVLKEGRETSMKEMEDRARQLGANAIVGIDVDYETIGAQGSMLMVAVSGTAVVID